MLMQEQILEVRDQDNLHMLVWEWIGEGYCGDYDPDDPEDAPLLRFTIYDWAHGRWVNDHWVDADWEQREDGSYCTLLPVGTNTELLKEFGKYLLTAGGKRELEFLTWMKPEELERIYNPKGMQNDHK